VSTAAQVGESLSELVRDERVQQRVESAVDVEDQGRDGWNIHFLVGITPGRAPLVPLNTCVVRQHAESKRDDDSRQQTDDLAPRRQRIVVGRVVEEVRRSALMESCQRRTAGRIPPERQCVDERQLVRSTSCRCSCSADVVQRVHRRTFVAVSAGALQRQPGGTAAGRRVRVGNAQTDSGRAARCGGVLQVPSVAHSTPLLLLLLLL